MLKGLQVNTTADCAIVNSTVEEKGFVFKSAHFPVSNFYFSFIKLFQLNVKLLIKTPKICTH